MLRIGSSRSALQASSRAVSTSKPSLSSWSRLHTAAPKQHAITSSIRPAPRAVPARLSLLAQHAYATKTNGFQQGIDPEADKKAAQRKLESHPEAVSTESSVRHVYEPKDPGQAAAPVQEGVADELQHVKDTFSLAEVPKEPYALGLAGTLPYLGTSVSTVYLAWVLNSPMPSTSTLKNNLMISQETAQQLLATLEPIQLGYGAIIISFLGAVHWGMEYAAKTPDAARTRLRYGLGVTAPMVAWPTLYMPVEFALTAQFAAFVALYFADARASVRGWAPAWYSTYRFALTAVVGVAIAISLIGRAKVGDASPRLTGLGDKFHETRGEEAYTDKWADREEEEREKIKKEKEEAERKKKEEEKKAKEEEKKSKKKGDKGEEEAGRGRVEIR
ncbi:hypothetical protein F4808DRAFT_300324 [Astrocystis sublimbata]|nr:hypothetical protein F4808DRAFT_300324 [Astrocystis sublimbata]